jgi:hypothetical protein
VQIGLDSHSSVVTRTTFSRSTNVSLTQVPGGRVAKLPSIDTGAAVSFRSGADSPSRTSPVRFDEGGSVTSPGKRAQSAASSVSFAGDQPVSFTNKSFSSGEFAPPSPPHDLARSNTMSSIGSANRNTSSDGHSVSSGVTGQSSRSAAPQTLLGPRITLTVRLKAEIYAAEVVSSLLQGSESGLEFNSPIIDSHILLPSTPYIAPMAPRKEGSGGSDGGGLAPIPPEERQAEVREVAAMVLSDLFRDISSGFDTAKQVCCCICL